MTGPIITIELLAGVVIAWHAIGQLNRHHADTRVLLSLAWVVLGAAGAAVVGGILAGRSTPDVYSATMMAATAFLLVIDRREQ